MTPIIICEDSSDEDESDFEDSDDLDLPNDLEKTQETVKRRYETIGDTLQPTRKIPLNKSTYSGKRSLSPGLIIFSKKWGRFFIHITQAAF